MQVAQRLLPAALARYAANTVELQHVGNRLTVQPAFPRTSLSARPKSACLDATSSSSCCHSPAHCDSGSFYSLEHFDVAFGQHSSYCSHSSTGQHAPFMCTPAGSSTVTPNHQGDMGSSWHWRVPLGLSSFHTGTGCSTSEGASSPAQPGVHLGNTPVANQSDNSSDTRSRSNSNRSASNLTSSQSSADLGGVKEPAVAAGAAAASNAARRAARSITKQVSRLVKLIRTTSLSEATWLQLTSVWQSHSSAITAASAAAATAGLYQLAAGAAGHFVDMADPTAYWGCLAASAAAVATIGLQVRSSFIVDPDRVYRITMRKLNRHAGLQEVLGSPLAGGEPRVELVTPGALFVQESLLPRRRAPRIQLLFSLRGPQKTGVVCVEAKKVIGSKYAFSKLMVELPDKPMTAQAAGAAAARAQAAVQPGGAAAQSSSTSASSNSHSSGDARGDAGDRSEGSVNHGEGAARIYLIGGPSAASSSRSTRHLSPSAVLEDLKEPLLFALKHNLPAYEAEDEAEGQLSWSRPKADPDQATWWDEVKGGTKLLACRAVAAARRAAAAGAATAGTAAAKLRQQASSRAASQSRSAAASSSSDAAPSGAASSTAGSSSSHATGPSGTSATSSITGAAQ